MGFLKEIKKGYKKVARAKKEIPGTMVKKLTEPLIGEKYSTDLGRLTGQLSSLNLLSAPETLKDFKDKTYLTGGPGPEVPKPPNYDRILAAERQKQRLEARKKKKSQPGRGQTVLTPRTNKPSILGGE